MQSFWPLVRMFFLLGKGVETVAWAAAAVAVGVAAAVTKPGCRSGFPTCLKHVDKFKMRLLLWVWLNDSIQDYACNVIVNQTTEARMRISWKG